MEKVFDITAFGAVSDGKTDCSAAIQAAIDAAADGGCVIVPPGRYLCADLKMHRNVCLKGFDAWSYHRRCSSELILSRDDARCVVNISGAVGCTICNLGIDGGRLGESIHGIMLDHPIYDAAKEEDTPTIDSCYVGNFSGDAVHFNHVWCATVRNNMFAYSENGFYHDGWDLFMCGNWLSGNRNCGYCAGKISSAVIFSQNRVEWNAKAGVSIKNVRFWNITGNQFDRAGGPQIKLWSTDNGFNRNITITGNSFNRSGSGQFAQWMCAPGYESCHLYAEDCVNLVFDSNVLHCGRDGKDSEGNRHYGPTYGIVYKHLRASIIKDNAMQSASVVQNIVDLGNNEEEVIVKDNVGTVMESEERWVALLSDKEVECIRSYFDLTDEEKKEMGLD